MKIAGACLVFAVSDVGKLVGNRRWRSGKSRLTPRNGILEGETRAQAAGYLYTREAQQKLE